MKNFGLLLKSVIIIILLYPNLIISQTTKINVAVLNFSARGISDYEVETLTDCFRDELVNMKQFRIMEREKMDDMLKEQGFQQTGCTSSECLVEVGQLINVQRMIGGSIGKVGQTYVVSVRVIDIEKGEVLIALNEKYKGEIDGLLTNVIPKMAGNITGRNNAKRSNSNNSNYNISAAILLRSSPESLSVDDMKEMLKAKNFYDSSWYKFGIGTINDFEQQTISGDRVVIDHATGLMWQHYGSTEGMQYKDAKEFIELINRINFAGSNDWRLPTLEEAMSLMESEKKRNGLYIDSVFGKTQRFIWTADQFKGDSLAWIVYFNGGYCGLNDSYFNPHVRLVRSGQSPVR